MKATKKQILQLAIALLDDDEGICEAGYIELSNLLADYGLPLALYVDATDGRFYLKDNAVRELRKA